MPHVSKQRPLAWHCHTGTHPRCSGTRQPMGACCSSWQGSRGTRRAIANPCKSREGKTYPYADDKYVYVIAPHIYLKAEDLSFPTAPAGLLGCNGDPIYPDLRPRGHDQAANDSIPGSRALINIKGHIIYKWQPTQSRVVVPARRYIKRLVDKEKSHPIAEGVALLSPP